MKGMGQMKKEKILCLGLSLIMVLSATACGGATGASSAANADVPAAEEAAGEAAAPAESGEPDAEAAGGAEQADASTAANAGEEIPESDISVKWDDSRIFRGTSLGNYKTVTTYEVKGYEDVPFIKASDYLDVIFEGKEKTSIQDGVMTITVNETTGTIDAAADTITMENPGRFRSLGVVSGGIMDSPEYNTITPSVKNQSTETAGSSLTISLKDYHMPVIAYDGDILMPFLALQNTFGNVAMKNELTYNGKDYFNVIEANNFQLEKPDEANKIAEQVLVNKRSRENAERTRINIKKKLQGNLDIANRVKKFVDCRTKDVQKRELYIVEGDSALGACKLSRDAEYQAIIPVRGKILNCLKSEYNKIFNSEIIIDIVKVLGCGVEAKTTSNKQIANFDIKQLRYNKVVICTDADVDGFQIRTLILTMFFRLMPELIKQGYVYIAQSPLYEINTKEKTYFAYSEKEKMKICNDIAGKKYTIQRSKGLGENEPDMMWLTTMNPKTRRLIRVNFDQEELVLKMFDVLLGEDIASRKEFIAQNGAKYMDLLDVM